MTITDVRRHYDKLSPPAGTEWSETYKIQQAVRAALRESGQPDGPIERVAAEIRLAGMVSRAL